MCSEKLYKRIFSLFILILSISMNSYSSSLIYNATFSQITPIAEEEKDLVYSVFSHKEPNYSEVIKRITNRENLEEDLMTFRFVDGAKTLIIGDSRVCGFRNINYGENTDLIGISGSGSYQINDIASRLQDDYYDEIIAWFSVNDYKILDKKATESDLSYDEKNINDYIFHTLSTISKKTKGKVYFVKNYLGKNVARSYIKNEMFRKIEKEIDDNDKYIVLETVIDADSKQCYDGIHYTLEGAMMIMYGIKWQIEKIYN